MRLWSDSWTHRERIPARFAAGRPADDDFGCDGPFPPINDSLAPHLLAEATHSGTCRLNRRLS